MGEPITKGLREYMSSLIMSDQTEDGLLSCCDNIDAIHRSLEQENERLRNASKRGDGWPLDADGVPICVGDMLAEGEASPERVKALMFDRDGWSVNFGFGWCGMKYYEWHHAKPDTWESIIKDAIDSVDGGPTIAALVARCKALAGEDE